MMTKVLTSRIQLFALLVFLSTLVGVIDGYRFPLENNLTRAEAVRIIGGRTLVYFLLGKYHQPVKENKIFMFLDLEGSTALALKLGDIGVQTMITKFFFDITEPIIENDGEIHRYIGDEVIATWPLEW